MNVPNESMFVLTRELPATEDFKRLLQAYQKAMSVAHNAVRHHPESPRIRAIHTDICLAPIPMAFDG